MKSRHYNAAAICILTALFTGCAHVGPRSISMGRASYNEAINTTEDQQMLMSVIKGCYGETASLLSVNSVAANIRVKADGNVQAGVGNTHYFTGNLVPLSGGLSYEENPTITYMPVHGDTYLRQLLSPVPLDILVLLVRNKPYTSSPLVLLANRINNAQNPDFLEGSVKIPQQNFRRLVGLITELHQAGVMMLAADPKNTERFMLLITGYGPENTHKVEECLSLLGLKMPKNTNEDIVVPVYAGVQGNNTEGLAIATRSTYDLIQILKASVEIPQEHIEAGLAVKFPPVGLTGENIRIHSSKDKPKQATIAVKHRGYWFYIDDADMHTKQYYLMVRTLWSTSIAQAGDRSAAPVLTIPVSR